MTVKRGALIVLEGCDRAGKSTQCRLLAEAMDKAGTNTIQMRFPDRTTPIGKMIDSYLTSGCEMDDKAIHLLFSANRWEAVSRMTELLNSGTNLVVDRYAYSGVAFTASKGISQRWCKSPDVGLPTPDAVIFLDIPLKEAQGRGGFGEERYEKGEIQKKVRHEFELLREPSWAMVDACRSIDQVHADILSAVTERTAELSPRISCSLFVDGAEHRGAPSK